MKLILLLVLFPLLTFSQIQIGADVEGEMTNSQSGTSVRISDDGTIIAFGAPTNSGNGVRSGHVRIYENQSGTWVQIGTDIDGEAASDFSGISLDLSSDGTIVAIGAFGNNMLSGHVRIYENQSGVWTQIGSDIDAEAVDDRFGTSVSLSSDGSIVAIGATNNDANGLDSGHVRVFENRSGTWVQIGSDIDGEAAGDRFGNSVSISSDGSIVAIGANNNDANGVDSGHVRVVENRSGTWVQIGSDIDGEAAGDRSGTSVSLTSDGSIVAIGARGNGDNGVDSGHVRVFENRSGTWVQIGSDIDGEAAGDQSGRSVSLSSNGLTLAVGAPFNNDGTSPTGAGNVNIYRNQSGNWVQVGQNIYGEFGNDQSGRSVNLSSDGSIVAIGAPFNFFNSGTGSRLGHVRVYDISPATLSTNDLQLEDIFTMYPNPTSDIINIELNATSTLERISIYNTLGQLIQTQETTTVDLSKLNSGSYYVEVITNKGKSTKQIIVD